MYQPHALLRFGGRWFETEEWSCGIRIGTDDNAVTLAQWIDATSQLNEDLEPRMLTDFRAFVESWFLRAGSQISNQARLDYVSFNAIGPNGRYADPGNPHTFEYAAGAAPTGPVDGFELPQLSVVISLRTAVKRGAGTKGRIYPPNVIAVSSTGRVGSTVAQGMADSFAQLAEDIGTYEELPLAGNPRVVVASNVSGPNGDTSGVGPMRIVTEVLVGDVVDTQRRRRNQLEEVYVRTPVVTV